MGKLISFQTWCHIIIFLGALLAAVGAFGSHYFGKKVTELKDRQSAEIRKQDQQKLNELQKELAEINSDTSKINIINTKIDQLLIQSDEAVTGEWKSINMIDVAWWFGGEVIDYIFLVFKASSGIIRGKLRLKGTNECYSFSTQANTDLPIAVRNLWLPEKNIFKNFQLLSTKLLTSQMKMQS